MLNREWIRRIGLLVGIVGLVWAGILSAQVTEAKESKKELNWVGCGISKKAFMGALAKAYEKKTGVKIKLQGGGATRGIVDTAAGKSDMGGSCRHALPRAEERGIKLVPVAWDALVVIGHPSNSVDNLTLDQLKNIFTGKITNWKQVGGKDQKIAVLIRKGKISGVGRMFRELAFHNTEQEYTASAKQFKSSGSLEPALEKNPNAIAVTGISSAKKRNVKLLKINGKSPDRQNIIDGSYILYRPLYLVVRQQMSDDVKKFKAFALSDEGQKLIEGEGTVSLKEGSKLWGIYSQQMKKAGVAKGLY